MKFALACLLVSLLGRSEQAFAQSPSQSADSTNISAAASGKDAWFSKDKMDHLVASGVLTGSQYYVLRKELDQSHANSVKIAVASTLVVGIAKEIYDGVSKTGTPSLKDLAADLIGLAAAALVLSR